MTAVIRFAEARRSASAMIRSSIRFVLLGAQVDWITKTSQPRTFSSISTLISPSEKGLTSARASGTPRFSQISCASCGLEFPAKILKGLAMATFRLTRRG
jgi:hypothetical protein